MLEYRMRAWKNTLHRIATHRLVELFPVRHAVKGYTWNKAGHDLKAAVDVALVGLPQGMAFAAMAGLHSIYGIMAATVGTFLAPLFSRCSLTVSGPSNATAFMLASFFLAASPTIHTRPEVFVPLIIFLAGVVCVICAVSKATQLMQFVSRSVLVGYITGAATLIVVSQLRYVIGLNDIHAGSSFFSMTYAICGNLDQFQWQPLVLGLLSFLLFIPLKRYFRFLPTFAIILTLMSGLNWVLCQPWAGGCFTSVRMLEEVTLDDLSFSVPELWELHNHVTELVPIVMGIAFLAILEQSLMTKTISAKSRESVDLNQDTFAVGMANIGSAFTTSLPCSASLTRSVLNYNAGAKTRFSGIYCGLLCLGITFALAAFPLISMIPHCVLSALVLANAISLYDFRLIRLCYRATPGDAAVMVSTFVAALLLPLHFAIFIGVVFSVSLFLRKAARPELVEYTIDGEGTLMQLQDKESRLPQISIVHVEGDLFFGAASLFRRQLARIAAEPNLAVIVLRMRNARNLDATSVYALDELITDIRRNNRHIILSGASRDVYRILRRSGVLEHLQANCKRGESNIFLMNHANPNFSTRRALMRAQQLMGNTKADISIYTTRSVKEEE